MTIDKSWMNIKNRLHMDYRTGVSKFVEHGKGYLNLRGEMKCPCMDCLNVRWQLPNTVYLHLMMHGIQPTYTIWYNHGEAVPQVQINNENDGDEIADMLADLVGQEDIGGTTDTPIEESSEPNPAGHNQTNKYDDMFKEMEKELYPGCRNFSALNFLVKLMHLKVLNKWSNKSFDMLLKLLNEALPPGTILPSSHYESKTKLRSLGLGYESIHVCKYDCAIYWKENSEMQNCPVCGESRWVDSNAKGKKVPTKVMRYFPLTPRLKRLYSSRHSAKDMIWHHSGRPTEAGILRHPADGQAWKDFDMKYPSFSADPRNVRLGIATDGFNPFGNMSNSYSMWPVIVIPYNMPPWKCMKSESLLLSILIPGPIAPGKDMDVFLRPLVEELKDLWENGVETRDASSGSIFTMRAAVMWTINDFPAYALMSGWSTKGYRACPTCREDTPSIGIRSKIAYIGHRRYLPMSHPFRKCKHFNGSREHRLPPYETSSDDIMAQLSHIQERLPGKHKEYGGTKHKRSSIELNWSKKSIFFELPYWQHLLLRHNLDVMHIEKNICESVLGTLLSIEGKSKDTEKARLDLADMNIRPELHLYKVGNKWKKPQASYTLSVDERRKFCRFIRSVRFPDGFASNLAKNVNEADGKISGLKSHDCHVLFQRLLPAGIRPYLRKEVREVIIELCTFFRQICSKTLNKSDLEKLDDNILIILCKLERIFPPAFFDIMMHLALHLPREATLGGPVHFRWMYPIERSMAVYKQYVKNRARPEGSIAEAYTVNEALTFCSMYFRDIETRFNRPERHDDGINRQEEHVLSIFKHVGRPFGKKDVITLGATMRKKAEWYVLNNCEEIYNYRREHKELLQHRGVVHVDQQHEVEFPEWFKNKVNELRQSGSTEVSDELYALANRSNFSAFSYPGCMINGVKFLVHKRDVNCRTQNSGIMVSSEDGMNFYGVLEEVLELSYVYNCNVLLFKCKWFDTDPRKKHIREDANFTSVYVKGEWYKNDPFIFASQAKLVYYMQDDKNGDSWQLVHTYIPRNIWDFPVNEKEVESSTDAIPILQETNSSGFQLWVELPDMDNVDFHRNDVEPIDVHNVDELLSQERQIANERFLDEDAEFADDNVYGLDDGDEMSDSENENFMSTGNSSSGEDDE